MAKNYKVLHRVEINGKDYRIGDIVPAKDFRPSSGEMVNQYEEATVDGVTVQFVTGQKQELSELDSLLASGHVEEA